MTNTYPFLPEPGTAVSPDVVEISMVGLRLVGADPEAVVELPALYETLTMFTRLLEVGWLPGRSLVIVQLSAVPTTEGTVLEVELGLGVAGAKNTTAVEAEVFGETAADILTGTAGVYAVEPSDPRSLLYADGFDHSALLRRRRLSASNAETICDVVSPLVGGFYSWQIACQTLLRSPAPLRLRTTLLAAEASVDDHGRARAALRAAADLAGSRTIDPNLAHVGATLNQTQLVNLERLHTPGYVAEVAITSRDRIPELVVRTLAASITRELTVEPGSEVGFAGGYEIEWNPSGLAKAHAAGVPLRGGLQSRDPGDLLPLAEAALACRWPLPIGTGIPTIPTRALRPIPAPAAAHGVGAPIGVDANGRPIRIDERTRTGHIHLLGATGTGKTTLMRQLIGDDLRKGRGFLLVDPHGDLADQTLAQAIELDRDPVSIDPSNPDSDTIAILAKLEDGAEPDMEDIDRTVAAIIEAVTSHLPPEWSGPVFRTSARAALTLLAVVSPDKVMSDVGRVLRSEDHGRKLLDRFKGPRWVGEQLHTYYRMREHADNANYVASKFDDFATNEGIRRVLTTSSTGSTFESLAATRRPIIVNLSKGNLSTLNSRHLGHLLLALALDAAFQRPSDDRELWSFYVDEAASFPVTNLERALAEGRKFGLGLLLAHQHLRQFPDATRDAILGNTATTVAFRLTPADAHILSEQLLVPERQLVSLPDLHGIIRTPVAKQGPATFSLRLHPYGAAPQGMPAPPTQESPATRTNDHISTLEGVFR